jgi:hypothetical protein
MEIDRVQAVAIVVSAGLLVVVLELVRRRKLVEEYSALWIASAVALLGLSIWREFLHKAAAELGVVYPPSLLLLLLVAMVFVTLLWFSVVLSTQRRQIERLIEDTAILGAEMRDLRARRPDPLSTPARGVGQSSPAVSAPKRPAT